MRERFCHKKGRRKRSRKQSHGGEVRGNRRAEERRGRPAHEGTAVVGIKKAEQISKTQERRKSGGYA